MESQQSTSHQNTTNFETNQFTPQQSAQPYSNTIKHIPNMYQHQQPQQALLYIGPGDPILINNLMTSMIQLQQLGPQNQIFQPSPVKQTRQNLINPNGYKNNYNHQQTKTQHQNKPSQQTKLQYNQQLPNEAGQYAPQEWQKKAKKCVTSRGLSQTSAKKSDNSTQITHQDNNFKTRNEIDVQTAQAEQKIEIQEEKKQQINETECIKTESPQIDTLNNEQPQTFSQSIELAQTTVQNPDSPVKKTKYSTLEKQKERCFKNYLRRKLKKSNPKLEGHERAEYIDGLWRRQKYGEDVSIEINKNCKDQYKLSGYLAYYCEQIQTFKPQNKSNKTQEIAQNWRLLSKEEKQKWYKKDRLQQIPCSKPDQEKQVTLAQP